MDADPPQYRIYGYYADSIVYDWTISVDGPCDDRLIEKTREHIAPDSENMPVTFCWAELFYCHGRDVRLVGTWVVKPGNQNDPEAHWYANGWPDRPRPSKERALRFLHELDRPI